MSKKTRHGRTSRPRKPAKQARSHPPHDGSYKHIFSHPEMVEGLLRDFVDEDWLSTVDFSTLERQNGSYVSDDLRAREDDSVWRVHTAGGWIYVYLLIEFQSRVDPWMALRIMVYTGPDALCPILGRLVERLYQPAHDSLRRALTVWISRVLLKRLLPGEQLPEMQDLQEIETMLAEHVEQWTENWKQQGLRAFSRVCRKGVRKGVRRVARRVASRKRALLLCLCPRRFGPLSPQAQARFERATLEQLETWADRLLDVQTLDELFGENPQSWRAQKRRSRRLFSRPARSGFSP